MAKSYGKAKGRNETGGYLTIPHNVIDSESWCKLSGNALKILWAIYRQYNGRNNGDLSAPFSHAERFGIGSETTWYKAIKELADAELIICTRSPTRLRNNPHGQCALYAVTWKPIDDCKGKIELSATVTPPRKFSIEKG